VETELKLGLKPEDAADTLRLVLHDAGTFDIATGTGGMNGSVVLSEELNRPENVSLKSIVERLKFLKAKIDEKAEKGGKFLLEIISFLTIVHFFGAH
jgi:L-ascorbate peroxidase